MDGFKKEKNEVLTSHHVVNGLEQRDGSNGIHVAQVPNPTVGPTRGWIQKRKN
jgi:hypothetical protein